MSTPLMKEKIEIVKSYLNEIDSSFKFISLPNNIESSIPPRSIKLVKMRSNINLEFYSNIERQLDILIDEPFESNINLMRLAERYLSGLKEDESIMIMNFEMRQIQKNIKKQLEGLWIDVQISKEKVTNNLELDNKGAFVQLLFTHIKQLNYQIEKATSIFQELQAAELHTTIDIERYIQFQEVNMNSVKHKLFNYDESAEQCIKFFRIVIDVIQNKYNQCTNCQPDTIAAKSATLALKIKESFLEGKEIFGSKDCKYHRVCSEVYSEFNEILLRTYKQLVVLQPDIQNINQNIYQILYLHFIKKREIDSVKQKFEQSVIQFSRIEEIQDNSLKNNLLQDVRSRCKLFLQELKVCKQEYSNATRDCFNSFFDRKKMKRKGEIKILKDNLIMFLQSTYLLEDILNNLQQIQNLSSQSQLLLSKVKLTRQQSQILLEKRIVRSKIPQQNVETNTLRDQAKEQYIKSEDIIILLRSFEKKFEKYINSCQLTVLRNVFNKTYLHIQAQILELYQAQEGLADIIRKEAEIKGNECSKIKTETEILLNDLYTFLHSLSEQDMRKVDNKWQLDEVGSKILKMLMRIKKKQAEIELNLEGQSMIVSVELRQELSKMGKSLDYQLSNLEGLGIIIESRAYFNQDCLVQSAYEFGDDKTTFKSLNSVLEGIPDHNNEVQQFIREFYPKLSEYIKKLAKSRCEVELYFFDNFQELKCQRQTIFEGVKNLNKLYNNTLPLMDPAYAQLLLSIVTSYTIIQNVIIDISTHTLFFDEFKQKLRTPLNQFLDQLKEQYVTDYIIMAKKTTSIALNFNQLKDALYQQILTILKANPKDQLQKQQIRNNLKDKLNEFFSLVKDIKGVKAIQNLKGSQLIVSNLEEYQKVVAQTEQYEICIKDIFEGVQSIEGVIEQQPSGKGKVQVNDTIAEVQQQLQSKYQHDSIDMNKKIVEEFITFCSKMF